MIELKNVKKTYRMGKITVDALRGISLSVAAGELVAIVGPSGSGKTTLMNIIGCLDVPTSGEYWLEGREVGKLPDNELARLRNQKIGFVFQKFNLLPQLTAWENVQVPLVYAGVKLKERRERSLEALRQVGLAERIHHRPNELSGGQQQRVAIARALVTRPSFLLADEPTGNLDSRAGREIIDLLFELNSTNSTTVIVVTHDLGLARRFPRVISIQDGQVVREGTI
ncbi:MAG: putative transport system ATP-binding protein [Bacillota bacterium]|jgi:putative ABC transport system ATP-binding protein|nr:putative transport system ATP-binding protein [Bacillota bacterium]MDK2960260.1 putative transport system ATP-binding protein [Bacillota bacterium]